LDNNTRAFLALVRAGLWEKDVQLTPFNDANSAEIFRLAQEQSVIGLVAAGLEHVADNKIPKEIALSFASDALQLEQRNTAMNYFIVEIVDKMRKAGIYALLVKGQGVAQCYERPLWRTSGDIDLLLIDEGYKKAKVYLTSLSDSTEPEYVPTKHFGLTINRWTVELHGSLRSGVLPRMDSVIDSIQEDTFTNKNVRIWNVSGTDIFIPCADNDVLFVFSHILKHFYDGSGVGLRQICDWCRLLWTYKESLNYGLLESRIRKAGIMKEWNSFSAFAVEYLGMPVEAMPFYDSRFKVKGSRILECVMESGNFGHNRDISYKQKYPFVIRYAISFWLYTKLAIQRVSISPRNAIMAWWTIVKQGANAVAKAICGI